MPTTNKCVHVENVPEEEEDILEVASESEPELEDKEAEISK